MVCYMHPCPPSGARQGCDWTRAQPTLEAPGHTAETVEAIDNTGMWYEV